MTSYCVVGLVCLISIKSKNKTQKFSKKSRHFVGIFYLANMGVDNFLFLLKFAFFKPKIEILNCCLKREKIV
ncbi:MAG TPA: hypothetical protein DDY21_01395 [Candidatus Moranbacteria bacterium]|nr:hypothetical protein [Candidatus Moranbacteria bacterium]